MMEYFGKTIGYLNSIDVAAGDPLDKKTHQLVYDEAEYEKVSQALRRRFSRGAMEVEGMDRAGRVTKIKRDRIGGKYQYSIQGADGNWFQPEERIWVVAMYGLWQDSKKATSQGNL